ncbi:unnamed protein product [Vitrella brassicaformis CCMP3155]|uniref:Carrier domain-containing protein n=1 Tax=Vitrella brassicaformis (strain CCMP3155) TaxID=1169540 RepID=A0A0G4GPG3_VITBC|nr:unnamed protein product [Vitrella brassicaformis CCMP3155]|eukprot:CEM32068.1 unnamed protein product [Vitrella brassicaformis CCMP3155]
MTSTACYVTTEANLMAIKPASMTFEEAAALPVVFVTVEVAFRELAKVTKGDNVLVHAASGGVGLAAIQYCRAVGANVYGTAGSQHKQDSLRQQGLQLVTSSRDANQFQADVKQTNSKVDVVLNCLIEDFIPLSLDAMAPKGRFMELGKRGIWNKEEVLARRPDLAMYEAMAIDQMMEQDPKWFGGMLDRLRGLVDIGKSFAKVTKGDNVLVHAASGGVGLAAIQYCRAVGANVYGTAGSQHKQDSLRQQGLQLVTSSRDANQFQADVKQTNSKVDVVLNCLIEDFIPLSLDAMAPKGRFMELGKRGIWNKEEVLARRPDLAMYEAMAIDQMMEQDPKWFGGMLDRLRGLVDVGKVKPIPLHTFDMSSADQVTGGIAAFRFMQRAQHIGKVVMQIPSAITPPHTGDTQRDEATPADRQADGCYVITGGLGGLGMLVADWLVDEGAKHIALVSRRGRPTDAVAASELWKKLTAPEPQGRSKAAIHCMAVDVSRKDECEKAFADLNERLPNNPVRGIFHAAGVPDDAALSNQTKDKVEKVYLPKVMGAWYLHELSLDEDTPLDHFMMFSSVASLLGNFGQANYSSANSCLDALTEYRRSKKLAAQSIQWGPWIQQGMAVELKQHLDKAGMRGITNDLGLRVLGDVMRHSESVGVTCCQVFKWDIFLSRYDVIPPFFETVRSAATRGAAAGVSVKLRSMDAAALKEYIHTTVVDEAATVLGMTEAPPLDSPLQELGIDSLGAVEFRNALSSKIGVKLPATTLFDYPTLNAIIDFIYSEVSGGAEEAAAVMGAWYLHELSLDKETPLDHFMMFSSVASLLGNFGKANYSSANSCLDALTEYRRSKKLAAQSIQWGPWTQQGMAVEVKQHLDKAGMRGITNDLGLRVLGDVMRHSESVGVTCCQVFKWDIFLSRYDVIPPFFETVRSAATRGAAAGVSVKLRSMDAAALKEHIHTAVVDEAATVLGMTEAPPLDSPLQELGIDSLGAVEFRNALSSKIGVKLPATTLFDYPTLNAIIDFIYSEVSGGADEAAAVDEWGVPVPVAMSESLAVVSVSCRLPGGVTTPSSFWSMLMDKTDCVDEVPLTRWNVDEVYDADPDAKGKCYTRKAAFMEAADMFDNAFFNIGPAEVNCMDPQQRLMLEVGYEAFHSAGLSREKLIGQDMAVLIGCCSQDWNFIDSTDKSSSYAGTGGAVSIVSNRISYVFGLKGPSMTIDTACSSSLVAMDVAVKDMRMGVCRGALVGGVNLMLSPHPFIALCKARMLSPDCKCQTFDAKANGYVRGEGACAVVLRRASDVEAMKLRRLATVLGSSVNHDGRSASLTAPSGPAQQEAIKEALKQAGVKPSAVSYIETHGTGTSLGDPIEFGALQGVLGPGRSDGNPLVLGALKTNIGHLEGAAGIAGLAKLIMTLLHGCAAPNLYLTQLNPYLDIEGFPVVFPTEPVPLVSGLPAKERMVGGVSSFGFGGANAHVLVEAKALSAAQIDEMLKKDSGSAALQNKIGFMFTGQGSQYVDMGRKLYDNEKVFRECIDECATILDPLLPSCYTTSLNILKENDLRSIAFSCISTGIFEYPNARAAKVALGTVRDWLSDPDNFASVDRVVFCTSFAKDKDI